MDVFNKKYIKTATWLEKIKAKFLGHKFISFTLDNEYALEVRGYKYKDTTIVTEMNFIKMPLDIGELGAWIHNKYQLFLEEDAEEKHWEA